MPAEPTIPALLRERAAADGDLAALVHDGDRITYAELDARTRSVATALAAAGVTKSARIGILLPNGIDWALVAYGATRIGATLVPLSTLLRPPELHAQLRTASVTHLVTTTSFRGRDYLADLDEIAPGVVAGLAQGTRHEHLPNLRHVWPVDDLLTQANLRLDGAGNHAFQTQVAIARLDNDLYRIDNHRYCASR